MVRTSIQKFLFFILLFIFSNLTAKPDTTQFQMIPMRDDTSLAADIYLPTIHLPPYPTILVRSTYGRIPGENDIYVTLVTELLGYAVVIQDTRGRGDSQGIDSLFFSDGWGRLQDGYDTVEWIARQIWSNGRVGMIGASALGITSYLAAGAAPPHLSCCVVIVGSSNLYSDALFYDGAYREKLVNGWMDANNSSHLIPFFKEHPFYTSTYDRVNLSSRFDSVQVPILHVGGWFDIFCQGTINGFMGIQESGNIGAKSNQKLLMGPWTHDISLGTAGDLKFPDAESTPFLESVVSFFNQWCKEDSTDYQELPTVQYYLMGDADDPDSPGNRWIMTNTWPPESTPLSFYLHADGKLNPEYPLASEIPDSFAYNPENPVPTIGGQNLNMAAGSKDQSSLYARDDILWYTTPLLEDTLTITGQVTTTLYASSDALDTDFTAKLCDVYPDGRSMLIADGIVRARHRNTSTDEELLVPGQIEEYTIDLWSTALSFAPGHRIELAISSSNDPRFQPNPNTGEPFGKATTSKIANQIIYHNSQYPSSLDLPVVDNYEWTQITIQEQQNRSFVLLQNYPNPFNSQTSIPLFVKNLNETIYLKTYNSRGQIIREWQIKPHQQAMNIIWDGTDALGNTIPSGIYFAQLQVQNEIYTQKMICIK